MEGKGWTLLMEKNQFVFIVYPISNWWWGIAEPWSITIYLGLFKLVMYTSYYTVQYISNIT